VQLACNPRAATVQLPCVPLPAYPYRSGTLARASSYWRVGIGAGLLSKQVLRVLAGHFLIFRAARRSVMPPDRATKRRDAGFGALPIGFPIAAVIAASADLRPIHRKNCTIDQMTVEQMATLTAPCSPTLRIGIIAIARVIHSAAIALRAVPHRSHETRTSGHADSIAGHSARSLTLYRRIHCLRS
jgi:hypothetical protein